MLKWTVIFVINAINGLVAGYLLKHLTIGKFVLIYWIIVSSIGMILASMVYLSLEKSTARQRPLTNPVTSFDQRTMTILALFIIILAALPFVLVSYFIT